MIQLLPKLCEVIILLLAIYFLVRAHRYMSKAKVLLNDLANMLEEDRFNKLNDVD